MDRCDFIAGCLALLRWRRRARRTARPDWYGMWLPAGSPPEFANKRGTYGVSLHMSGAPNEIDDVVWPLFELAKEHGASLAAGRADRKVGRVRSA